MAATLELTGYNQRELSLGRRQVTAEYESPTDTTIATASSLVGTLFPDATICKQALSGFTGVMGPRCVEVSVTKDHYASGLDRIIAHYVSRDWQDYLYNTPNKFLMFIDPASTSQSSITDLDGHILSGQDTLNSSQPGDPLLELPNPDYEWNSYSGEDVNILPKKRITLWGFVAGGSPYANLCTVFDAKEGYVNSNATMGTLASATGKLLYQGYSDRRVFAASELHEIKHTFILSPVQWNSQHKIQRYSYNSQAYPLWYGSAESGWLLDMNWGYRLVKRKHKTGTTQGGYGTETTWANTDWFYARHCLTQDFSSLHSALIDWPTS